MNWMKTNSINLALSGGGIKGISFLGAYEVIEKMGISIMNISGVSAGALAGAFMAAGYRWWELNSIMGEFDFSKIELRDIPRKVPVVPTMIKHQNSKKYWGNDVEGNGFLDTNFYWNKSGHIEKHDQDFKGEQSNWFENLINFSKMGCLLDGDYLEEWVGRILSERGVLTFKDIKTGIADETNPNGYKVRMTAVDANEGKIIVLPDDISYYGIAPDDLEVAKAVRMSTSIPFLFKPVELVRKVKNEVKTHYIIDGGVVDNLPYWLLNNKYAAPIIGFWLNGGDDIRNPGIFDYLNILKTLFLESHEAGVPKANLLNYHQVIVDTSKVPFLDFNLDDEQKKYLYNEGVKSATDFFKNYH